MVVCFIGVRTIIWSNAVNARHGDGIQYNCIGSIVEGKKNFTNNYVIFIDTKASKIIYDEGDDSYGDMSFSDDEEDCLYH